MAEFFLNITDHDNELRFRGDELARLRADGGKADPYSRAVGPELVVYRTHEGMIVITCDDVEQSDPDRPADGPAAPGASAATGPRTALHAERLAAQDMTDTWLVNTAHRWGISVGLLHTACEHCREVVE